MLIEKQIFEIFEELKNEQWSIQIHGSSWYDGDIWEIIIKDPLGDIVSNINASYPKTCLDGIREALTIVSEDINGECFFRDYKFNKI